VIFKKFIKENPKYKGKELNEIEEIKDFKS
jgi:hypothetical protein